MDAKEQAAAFLTRYFNLLGTRIGGNPDPRFGGVAPLNRADEADFALGWALPALQEAVLEQGISGSDAVQAVLAESRAARGVISSGTPARGPLSPFSKNVTIPPDKRYKKWCQPRAMVQACPDFALRAPFPHRIVFEAKYFRGKKSADAGRRALVDGIYEAAFYLGLPAAPARRNGADYGYDYGCLVALDGSDSGSMWRAWNELRAAVRKGFWDGANLRVSVIAVPWN